MKKLVWSLIVMVAITVSTGCTVRETAYSPGYNGYVYSANYYDGDTPYWDNSYNSSYIYNTSNYYGNPLYNQAWVGF